MRENERKLIDLGKFDTRWMHAGCLKSRAILFLADADPSPKT